jgi:hypothetical protein
MAAPFPAKQKYEPRDQLYLWWLADPAQPTLIGELHLVRSTRGVSLRYADSWIASGFALSEDLPLLPGQEFLPKERDTAAGAVDDARPDRWGERVIRIIDKPPRLSLLEYLYFAGDDRFGALSVSLSDREYLPRRLGPLPTLADTEAIASLVRKVIDGERVPPALERLVAPGVTLGGARPKALIDIDGIVTDAAELDLSPAYDVLPSAQGLGYQQMRVGTQGADATLDNALSMCAQFGLKPVAARAEIRRVVQVVESWREHFATAGVTPTDIELLAEHIDRAFLREQRLEFTR